MKVRRLSCDHDWSFGNGRADYLTQSDAIAQCVMTRLLSLKRDWFMNEEFGLDWFAYLVKNPDLRQMESALKSIVLRTEGVVEIVDFDIVIDSITRQCSVSVLYKDIFDNEREVITHAPNNE